MKKEIAKQWVAELRSGKYKQGISKLKATNNTYCCLGVLCQMAEEAGVITGQRNKNEGFYKFNGLAAVLPGLVMQWAGIKTDLGTLPQYIQGKRTLASLNDAGHSFEEIANIIEKQYEGI